MFEFTKEDLVNLEKLSRIRCEEEEEENFLKDLYRIIDYINQLKEVDTENVHPCNYVLKDVQRNITRKDICEKTLSKEEFLSNAPEQIGGMIQVPPVIKSL